MTQTDKQDGGSTTQCFEALLVGILNLKLD